MAKKPRTQIPQEISAEILFKSDRTCCVCRDKSKPVQIHHIDENPDNHEIKNLAVICLECHNKTQIRGGFDRKLDSDQIKLYRDDWHNLIAQQRSQNSKTPVASREFKSSKIGETPNIKVEVAYGIGLNELGQPIDQYIITAKNFGNKTVILSSVYFELPKGMKLLFASPMYQRSLPYKLEPGDSFSVAWPMSNVKHNLDTSDFSDLKETRAFFVDKLENKYYSDRFSLDFK